MLGDHSEPDPCASFSVKRGLHCTHTQLSISGTEKILSPPPDSLPDRKKTKVIFSLKQRVSLHNPTPHGVSLQAGNGVRFLKVAKGTPPHNWRSPTHAVIQMLACMSTNGTDKINDG